MSVGMRDVDAVAAVADVEVELLGVDEVPVDEDWPSVLEAKASTPIQERKKGRILELFEENRPTSDEYATVSRARRGESKRVFQK